MLFILIFHSLRKHQETQTDMTDFLYSDPLSKLFADTVMCDR